MNPQRQRILDALATVEGIAAYPAQPDTPTAGDAWPVLREGSRDGRLAAPFTRTYEVFAVLPASYLPETALDADELIERLATALEKAGEWQQPADTVQIALGNQTTMPGVRVRLTVENC